MDQRAWDKKVIDLIMCQVLSQASHFPHTVFSTTSLHLCLPWQALTVNTMFWLPPLSFLNQPPFSLNSSSQWSTTSFSNQETTNGFLVPSSASLISFLSLAEGVFAPEGDRHSSWLMESIDGCSFNVSARDVARYSRTGVRGRDILSEGEIDFPRPTHIGFLPCHFLSIWHGEEFQ